jgi:hypothetical protein
MSKLKNVMLTSAGLVILACSMIFTGPHVIGAQNRGRGITPQAPSVPVTVENAVANPVPTVALGTTTVAGSVSLAGGTLVGLDALNNTVKVTTSETSPLLMRDVDNPARHAFQLELDTLIPQGQQTSSNSFAIPAGKRLVIEYASGTMFSPPADARLSVHIQTIVNNTVVSHYVVPSLQGSFGQNAANFYVASQPMKLYADPGTSITLITDTLGAPSDGQSGAALVMSGYLVNVP